jgi:uncharacterized protein YbjT (DUF2867 family)
MFKKIAVIGATGMLGRPVTQQLLKSGFDLTLLSRNPAKAKALFPTIPITEADVFDPISLLKALEHQEIVYISLGPSRKDRRTDFMPEREGINNIIEASKHLGLKRIVLLSSLVQNYEGMNGFNWWIFDMKIKAVEAIKSSGIPYTIFYPSSFMESIPRDLIKGNKLMLTSGSVAPMWFIAGEDYGRQVARALSNAGNSNQEYSIQGPAAFDWEQAAKIIVANYKVPLKIMRAPIGLLKFFGNFSKFLNYAAHICEALNKYPEKFESENTWQDLGKPEITLSEYIKKL